MKTNTAAHPGVRRKTDMDSERLELARAVYELYALGLITEEIDEAGIPRFRPTGRQP